EIFAQILKLCDYTGRLPTGFKTTGYFSVISAAMRSAIRQKYCRVPSTVGPVTGLQGNLPKSALGEVFRLRASSASETYVRWKSCRSTLRTRTSVRFSI